MSEYTMEQAPFGYVDEHDTYHDTQAEQAAQDTFDASVREERRKLLIRQEAKRQLAAANSNVHALPGMATLTDLMARPRPPIKWRVENMWPKGGRVNLVAAAKSGKTTMLSNLVRSLIDGDRFLGAFDADRIDHDGPAVVIFDFEMTEHQITDWYKDQGIRDTDRVVIVPLKGYASGFNFMDPTTRDELAARYAGGHTYVLDPAGPVLAALGMEENSNSNVQQFLTDWDEFVRLMGGKESVVTVHAGHNAERARGASAFLGSGDAIWTMVRDGDETSSPRYLKATGRDVDLPETGITYDKHTRRLRVVGGNRKDAKTREEAERAITFILTALEEQGEMTGSAVEAYVKNRQLPEDEDAPKRPGRNAVREGLKLAVEQGFLEARMGARNATLYRISVRRIAGGELDSQGGVAA